MAGKKKKTLANKLAKMSDEERARYMQHRADIEEEAKRRKEQLITTFMKKKIRREEAFTRLNVAKINQNWHQIMRKSKCKQMREDVEHLKKWIEDQVNNKNDKIAMLMKDLERAENEYIRNFGTHSAHIDDILENQNQYVEKLKLEYKNDLDELMRCAEREQKMIMKNTEREENHLKTIVFGQDTQAKEIIKKEYEEYMQKCYETECEFETRLDHLRKSRESVIGAIWGQIAATVGRYVAQNDVRRAHLAELRRLDEESAADIAKNEGRIKREELLIEELKEEYSCMESSKDTQIRYLQLELTVLNNQFEKIRRILQTELKTDEKQMRLLSDESCKTERYLENLARRGQFILSLGNTCKKLETERDKILKWMPLPNDYLADDVESTTEETKRDTLEGTFKSKELLPPILPGTSLLSSTCAKSSKPKERPKTTIPATVSPPSYPLESSTPELEEVSSVQNITLQTKTSVESPSSSSSASTGPVEEAKSESLLDRCIESLKGLEGFWFTCNKVEVDCLELQEEKKVLSEENKKLKGMVRAVLEAAATSKSVANSGVSTRNSPMRTACSAPFRRIAL